MSLNREGDIIHCIINRIMSKLKKIIIFITIVLIVLLVILVNIIIHAWKEINIEGDEIEDGTSQEEEINFEEYSTKEDNDHIFFTINDTIQLLFDYVYESNSVAVYNMTDKEYIKNNNINNENIIEIYTNEQNRIYYSAQEIYKTEKKESCVYYIYGYKISTNGLNNYYIKMQTNYRSFSLEPLSKEEFDRAKDGKIKNTNEVNITANDYNSYETEDFSTKELLERYMKDYKIKLKYIPELAYVMTNEEDKKDKFPKLEDFNKYIKERSTILNEIQINIYETEIYEDHIEYCFTDYNSYKYKIERYGVLDYKISFLDNEQE